MSDKKLIWNQFRGQATLNLKGQNITTYASHDLDFDEITEFYSDKNPISNPNLKSTVFSEESSKTVEVSMKDARLKLSHVAGFQGNHYGRHNLVELEENKIAYFTASVVIILDLQSNFQKIFQHHTSEISCLCLHPNKKAKIIASAQSAKFKISSYILIWKTETFEILAKIGENQIFKNVIGMTFLNNGAGKKEWLACVDDSKGHVLRIYYWRQPKKKKPTIEVSTFRDQILGISEIVSFEIDDSFDRYLAIFGKQLFLYHFKIQGQLDENLNKIDIIVKKKNCNFSKLNISQNKPKLVTCFTQTKVSKGILSGHSNGLIIYWGNDIKSMMMNTQVLSPIFTLDINARDAITAIAVDQSSTDNFFSATSKGLVCVWNLQKAQENNPNPVSMLRVKDSIVKMVPVIANSDNSLSSIIYGTNQNNLIEFDCVTRSKSLVTSGHTQKITGLCFIENTKEDQRNFEIVTASFDGKLQKYANYQPVWQKKLEEPITAINSQIQLNNLVVGLQSGKIMVFSEDGDFITEDNLFQTSPVTTLEYSHDGQFLAAGYKSGKINIFMYQNAELALDRNLPANNNPITAIDWTLLHNQGLRSQTSQFELQVWDLTHKNRAEMTQNPLLMSEPWLSNNVTLDFNSLGIWNNYSKFNEIQAICHHGNDLAIGDIYGKIKIFRYPCWKYQKSKKNHLIEIYGHSNAISKLKFLPDHTFLISVDNDGSIFHWKNNKPIAWNRSKSIAIKANAVTDNILPKLPKQKKAQFNFFNQGKFKTIRKNDSFRFKKSLDELNSSGLFLKNEEQGDESQVSNDDEFDPNKTYIKENDDDDSYFEAVGGPLRSKVTPSPKMTGIVLDVDEHLMILDSVFEAHGK